MKLSFAQFPKWKDLPKAERSSLFGQACQLWEAKEYDKAEQLFRYLWEND